MLQNQYQNQYMWSLMFKSRREIHLEFHDRGIINSKLSAKQLVRLRYPIKNIRYDKKCNCGSRIHLDKGYDKLLCLGCNSHKLTGEAESAS